MAGRKSLREELGIIRRYADLTEPYFKFIAEMLDPESSKEDRKWAAERLDKAFPKFIPTTLEGDGDDGEIVIKLINYGSNSSVSVPTEGISEASSPSS